MILLLGISLGYMFFLCWGGYHWGQIATREPDKFKKIHFSVIIPVRNEEANIARLIGGLMAQSYPKELYSVILVDDHSEDATMDIAKTELEKSGLDYQLVSLQDFQVYGKKQAISKGVNVASGEIVITTDGDCLIPEDWIKAYAGFYSLQDYQMVLGPVKMKGEGFFTKIQAVEFAGLVGMGASNLQAGLPGMCNGANLSYKKSAFVEVNGYEGNLQIASGDDEFLLQKIFNRYPRSVGYLKSQKAVVETSAKPTLGSLIGQRLRWSGKWKFHKSWYVKLMAVLVFLNYTISILSFWMVFGDLKNTLFFVAIFILRWLVLYRYEKPILRFFGIPGALGYALVIEIIYPYFVVFLGFASMFGEYSWKGRHYP